MRMTGGWRGLGRGALAALLAFAGAGAGAGRAAASTLNVLGYTLGEQVQIAAGATTGSVHTAEFRVALDGQSGFSYCVDLAQTIGVGSSTDWNVLSPLTNPAIVRAAWLVDRFHGDLGMLATPTGDVAITQRMAITALQVAVWETLYDTTGAADLFAGSFAPAQNGASANALLLANGFLGELADADLSGFAPDALWAVNARRQDQLVFTNPIPEPSSILLLGVGGTLVAVALRRQRA